MIIDMSYWTRVFKRILYVILILIGLFLIFKLSIFYMPFLIAFIISLFLEPAIKFFMKKMKFTRRISSIIIFLIAITLIIGIFTWIITSLISESSNLLKDMNIYIEKIYSIINGILTRLDKINLPIEIDQIIEKSTNEIFISISNWLRDFLTGLLNFITSIPSISVYFIITIFALYLICVDRIYIIDQIEHHIPKTWLSRVGRHIRDLTKTLGGYLKAEITIIFTSFMISLIGLYILKFAKFNIEFPLLMALFVGFVDALPILGSGTVMLPWAIISALNGDLKLGIALIILLIIMSITRQFLEPRLVSKHIGTHPIFTLIAMYTGFKFVGVFGMLLGPIILIIIKNVFATLIDDGIIKSLFDKN